MSFESIEFAGFVLLVITSYWTLPRLVRNASAARALQKWLLLAVSVWFYGLLGWGFVGLLGLSTVVNYGFTRWIERAAAPHAAVRTGVLVNLALLGFFKYYDFFRENLDAALDVLGLSSHLPALHVLLPIGISFYTFQAIAYVVELGRGKASPPRSLLDFALFQVFFVQLLMGPICRGRELLRQIEAPAPERPLHVQQAFALIATGLFKRMILAAMLAAHGVSEAFYAPDNYTAVALWVSMVAYTVQIYCDFSGYVDLMRGVALLLGFDIPDNFNRPYIATSVGDFWRRWHITFSNWLRDFIYFPLGGSHTKTRARTYFNLFVTMFVCGIWHGASWGFVIWGSLHGLALVHYKWSLDRARDRGFDPKTMAQPWFVQARGWLWTMGVVCFSRIFFVAADLETAVEYLRRMFDLAAPGDGFSVLLVAGTLAGLGWNVYGHRIRDGYAALLGRQPAALQGVVWFATLWFLLLIRPGGESANAYFGF